LQDFVAEKIQGFEQSVMNTLVAQLGR